MAPSLAPAPTSVCSSSMKQDDFAFGFFHLFQHGLQAVFKFAAVLGTGNQRPHVQGHQATVFQAFGNISGHDALGQPFHDGGFAHPGFADQHRVVLGAAREHLDDAPDFIVPADHRIQPAAAGHSVRSRLNFFEGLVFFFRVGIGDPLRSPNIHEHLWGCLLRAAPVF
jgi:hypothetical protein